MLKPENRNGKKNARVWSLGGMSGTSVDGVDAAMVLTDGETLYEFGPTFYQPYSASERELLLSSMGKWPQDRETPFAAEVIEIAHVKAFSRFINTPPKVEIIGFHGQTLAHDPGGKGTHQAGDGRVLANALGIPVVWDFRTADVEMGGQGAPLAPFFHFACAKWIKATAPVVFLNLGGVGNVTWVDPNCNQPTDAKALMAFDTGPANAPIDDFVQKHFNCRYDKNGEIAAKGQVNHDAISRFFDDPYFFKIPPKSLDRNSFKTLLSLVDHLAPVDAVATLTMICARSVLLAEQFYPIKPSTYYVCGGGRRNKTLVLMLAQLLDADVVDVDTTGLDGDMLEAQAFAYLAVRVVNGLATSSPATTGVPALLAGGLVSKPDKSGLNLFKGSPDHSQLTG